jgi:hypothetical protein
MEVEVGNGPVSKPCHKIQFIGMVLDKALIAAFSQTEDSKMLGNWGVV